MIYPHTDLKFRITITASDFSQENDDWSLRIIDRFNREVADFAKNEFFRDSLGNWYFDMPNVLTGEYRAITTIGIPDDDFNKQLQMRTDCQKFLWVNMPEKPCGCGGHTDGMRVVIERVYVISVDDGDYLADAEGDYILTGDGKRIQFNVEYQPKQAMAKVQLNMSGDDFKKLIEGNEPNSEVNTIPEVMAVMQGISDSTTVKRKIDEEVEPKMDGVTQEQFDAIFGNE